MPPGLGAGRRAPSRPLAETTKRNRKPHPPDDGRAAPETAELDGAVEKTGIGGDQD